ncbi:predicted protein [Methanosarcina acetivorans C2A]|uniref:Uncharacterized protein n=1 Tax=Methanosarcina acetivorans (strain ATCC 35395 / DSM 2834 / JCM 12185 / C2A) TaxID=188937 RepID=Q8TK42_METAC|nr:predicted protein [Methanosarcina acetivorans C2A]
MKAVDCTANRKSILKQLFTLFIHDPYLKLEKDIDRSSQYSFPKFYIYGIKVPIFSFKNFFSYQESSIFSFKLLFFGFKLLFFGFKLLFFGFKFFDVRNNSRRV